MKKKSASQSAFFKLRLLLGVLLCFAAVSIVLLAQPRTPSGPGTSAPPPFHAQYRGVMPVVKFDISPPLRDMKPLPWKDCTLRENEERGPMLLGPVGPVVAGSCRATGTRSRLEYLLRSSRSMETAICAAARLPILTERSARIML